MRLNLMIIGFFNIYMIFRFKLGYNLSIFLHIFDDFMDSSLDIPSSSSILFSILVSIGRRNSYPIFFFFFFFFHLFI